jgi:hypothetical protein
MTDRRRGRLAIPPTLAAIAASLALIGAAGASAAECPADYCTERTTMPNGIFELKIPPKYIAFIPIEGSSELVDCTWQVRVDFGDGSEPEKLEFDASKEFSASHQFPEPGVYYVEIYAEEGIHAGNKTECPDEHIQAKVTYPEPPPKETEEPGTEGPGTQPPGGGGGAVAAATPPPAAAPTPAPGPPWRACGGGIRAHLVACRRAKRVIRAARAFLSRAKLEQGASFQAAGFSCRLRGNGNLSCRRGRQRVLGT